MSRKGEFERAADREINAARKEEARKEMYKQFAARQKSRKIVQSRFDDLRRGFSILGIVFLLILCAVLIRRFNNSDDIPTFESLLHFLTEMPAPSIPFLSFSPSSFGDWGAFNFLRDFFATFSQVINVLIFLVNGLIVLVNYVIVFMRWLFVF